MPMTNEQLSEFCEKHDDVIDSITDVFSDANISPEDGEKVLLYIAGMSAGLRQAPILNTTWLEIAAIGWKIGVEGGKQ